ncbi:Sugar transferase SypR involved in lipopolysaccharide synthesis [Pseudoalteromonas luteoviolacea B = ATCC 29581]|nr:Sugar transferase SypR involved in lipopolysaccharide synthesis [Pseudoalteromonas luteoviolacea B = ATCC 29581]
MSLIEFVIFFLLFLIVYHHVIYPKLLTWFSKKAVNEMGEASLEKEALPRIAILMCAYNEEATISEKLHNLSILKYPNEKFTIHLLLDGCTDKTEQIATQTAKSLLQQNVRIEIHQNPENLGKCKSINKLIEIAKATNDVLVFSDVSALLSIDALERLALHFKNDSIHVVSGKYHMLESTKEQAEYWAYQTAIKQSESKLGAMIGGPGAMLALRSSKVETLEADTINDDFILAMRAISKGGKAILDDEINLIEISPDDASVDFARRKRIGAGNFQQILRLKECMKPTLGWTAFNFISHKVLRGLMPLVLIAFYGSLIIGVAFLSPIATTFALGLVLAHSLAILKVSELCLKAHYLIKSYLFSFLGISSYLRGEYGNHWKRVEKQNNNRSGSLAVHIVKRLIDLVGATTLLLLLSPIMMLSALVIKFTSKGPIIFKQLRVGEYNEDYATLFYVYKFRSMVTNAEKLTGAVWATKNDPRITPVGRFIRKTRIDELPQLFNVIKGDMSLIGPRPERPDFYTKLENEIPFFTQRTFGLKPGISGLAQVMNGYDEDIEGVRRKIAWDYAYALSMSNFSSWISMEINVFFKTIMVVVTGKGQ